MMNHSLHGEVPLHDAFESVLELHVARRVAEGVDGRVQVAEEVGEHVEVHVDAGGAEAGDDGDHVVRRPARRERPQDDRDRLERLPSAVLRLELVLLLPEPDSLSDL